MKLSKRLKAICDMVPFNSDIIDVGTDHGYTAIYLNKVKNCRCLATDISKESLNKAINNAKKANADVSFKLTDGLQGINLKNEIIIISGMGTLKILKIINNIENDLIICTNNDLNLLKEKLNNFKIYKEVTVFDKKNYHIIYFKKAN